MATCQMMPNKPTTKVLPAFGETELACTMQQSTTFVKKLVTVAMSTIMYMRGIFPEHCFGDRMVGDLLVKLIRPVQDDEAIGQLIQLMGGCYDAIEKRYLKRMTVLLCTNDEDTESVVESYACEMSYMGGKLSISRNGEELFDSSNGREIKESTVRLMRSLLLSMQTFDSLPGELFIHLKLAYYPDVTPDDYHPHGFVQAQPNTFKFARENTLKFIVGQVHTPFHSVGMHVKSLFCQEWKPDGEDKEIDVSQTEVMNIKQTQNGVTNRPATQKATGKALPPTETQTIGNAKKLQKASTLKKRVPTPHSRSIDEVAIRQPNRQGMVPIDASLSPDIPNQEAAQPEPATSQTSYTVRCPCRFDMDDGLMVQCDKCSTWQHCVCFGLVKETDVPSIHYCVICSRECQLDCTDPDLAALHGVALRAMCLWRKAVFVVLTEHKSDPFTDSHLTARLDVESGVAQGILKRLEKEGVVKPKRTIGRGSKSFIAAKSLSVEELKVYFKDSVRMFRGKDKPADSSKEENHVENLTQRTAGLQLGNRKRPITDKQENGISSKDSHISPDKRQYSKRLAKRALERMGAPPPAECSRDSDMIDSQPKRRKQSISKKAIRV